MTPNAPHLHFMCGKIASGKSTLAARLAAAPGTVLLSEDDWLKALFDDQLSTGADYMRCSARLKTAMAPHIRSLIDTGVTVVLDFAANTVAQRSWMRDLVSETGARHHMHVLDVPDAVCLARLRHRNAEGQHAFAPSEEMFHRFSAHFTLPTPEEGFTLKWHIADT